MIDETALREALINSIVHNDYSREVPPVVEIFSDRLTITSYGGLPQGLSRTNFFRCRSMPRNRELMRIFRDVDLVEQLGSGMSRILKVYDQSIFSFEDDFMIVTFPYANGFMTPVADKVADKVADNTT
jgi:predicted HTH transcriptional regulator